MARSSRRGANLVAAGIFLSRIAGLVRTLVIAAVIGRGTAADAFAIAMRMPNVLQNLLGEGSLSASFIPVYAKLVADGKDEEADNLAGAIVSLLALVTAVLVLIGVLAARPIVWLFTSGGSGNPATYELAISLFRITVIGLGFLVISAWCLGILNSHRSFFLSYVSPVIWNLAQILVLVFVLVRNWDVNQQITALAWAVVAGGLAQVLVQLPKVRKLAPTVRANLGRTPELRDVLRRFTPAVGARGVLQISSWADLALASLLVTGALSSYTYALRLYMMPISIFGFSVAASELAEMSRVSDKTDVVASRLTPALKRVIIPAGFVTACYLGASRTFMDALFGFSSRLAEQFFDSERGLTEESDIAIVALIIAAFAIGLPAAMTARVTQNTLYTLGDTKGPAKIAVVRVATSIVIGAILMVQLDWMFFDDTSVETFGAVPHWPPWDLVPADRRAEDGLAHLGAAGLALGSSIAAWTEWFLLKRLLQTKIGQRVSSGLGVKVAVVGAATAAVVYVASRLTTSIPSPLDAVIVGLAGLAVYGAVFWKDFRS